MERPCGKILKTFLCNVHSYYCNSERVQCYSRNHTAIQQPTLSCRDPHPLSPHPLSPPTYASSSLSETSYIGCNLASGNEIKNNSDVQSNSYCASLVRSHCGSICMPSNTSTFTSDAYSDEGPETWQRFARSCYQHNASLPNHFDHPFTKLETQDYIPYNDNPPEYYRPVEYPSNVYSGIGSQFHHVETRDSEENPLMDPVLSHDLLTASYTSSNVTVANLMDFEYHLQPLIPNCTPDQPVPPAVSTPTAYANIASYNASPRHTGRTVMPIHELPRMDSTSGYSSTDPTTLSSYSSSTASVDTSHFNESLNLENPYFDAALGVAGTHNSAHVSVAWLGYPGLSTSMPGTEESQTLTPHLIVPTTRLLQFVSLEKLSKPNSHGQ